VGTGEKMLEKRKNKRVEMGKVGHRQERKGSLG
jgi:hypothetical protein